MYATGVMEEAMENGGIACDVGTKSYLNVTSSSFNLGHTFGSVSLFGVCYACVCLCVHI